MSVLSSLVIYRSAQFTVSSMAERVFTGGPKMERTEALQKAHTRPRGQRERRHASVCVRSCQPGS